MLFKTIKNTELTKSQTLWGLRLMYISLIIYFGNLLIATSLIGVSVIGIILLVLYAMIETFDRNKYADEVTYCELFNTKRLLKGILC